MSNKLSAKPACPQCAQPTVLDSSNPWRPFCSERCKMVDLGAWISGRYAIASDDDILPEAQGSERDPSQ